MKNWQFGILLFAIISLIVIFVMKKPITQIQWDLSDRTNGICAPMYKEGFEWGQGQIKLDVQLQNEAWAWQEEQTDKRITKEERGLFWLQYMKELST